MIELVFCMSDETTDMIWPALGAQVRLACPAAVAAAFNWASIVETAAIIPHDQGLATPLQVPRARAVGEARVCAALRLISGDWDRR